MTTRPDDLDDPRFDDAWRRASREQPPAALDDAIRAAAKREVGARPHDVASVREATRPERWWFPLAAAATIGAIAIGLLQVSTSDRVAPADERRVVSDTPEGAQEAPAASEPRPSQPAAPLAKEQMQPAAPVEKPKAEREAKTTPPASPPVSAGTPRAQRLEPQAFPATKRDAARSFDDEAQRAAAPAPKKAEAAAEPPIVTQSIAPGGRVTPERASDSRAMMRSRLAPSATGRSDGASNAAAGTIAPAPPPEEVAAAAPPVAAAAPMAAPQRVAGKLAADRRLDSAEARAKERAAMPIADWIALMRRLRDERRFDELAREIATFRSLHGDANALPADLRDFAPPAAAR